MSRPVSRQNPLATAAGPAARGAAHDPRQLVSQLIREHHALVYRVAYSVLGQQADAEDATQSVFLGLLDRRDLPPLATPRAWLARVTINAARNQIRSEQNRRRRERAHAEQSQQRSDAMNTHQLDDLRDAVEELPEDLRLPVVLHYQEGFQYQEIAAMLDCPEGTVGRRLNEARERLREKLLKAGGSLPSLGQVPLLSEFPAPPVPSGLAARLLKSVQTASVAGSVTNSSVTAGTTSSTRAALRWGLATVAVVTVGGLLFWAQPWSVDRTAIPPELAHTTTGSGSEESNDDEPARVAGADAEPGADVEPLAANADLDPGVSPAGVAASSDLEIRIFGHLRDTTGKPVRGGEVRLMRDPTLIFVEAVLTDADGSYEFVVTIPATEDDEIVAVAGRSQQDLDAQQKELEEVRRALLGQGGKLPPTLSAPVDPLTRGDLDTQVEELAVVFGELERRAIEQASPPDHSPIHDSRPADIADPRSQVRPAQQQAQGMGIIDDALRLQVVADGYQAGVFSVTYEALRKERSWQHDFAVEAGGFLGGTVVMRGGRPLAEATVTVVGYLAERSVPVAARTQRTDGQGAFLLRSLPPGPYVLEVRCPGFVPVYRTLSEHTGPTHIALDPATTLDVSLTHASGQPASGMTVILTCPDGSSLREVCDTHGSLRFTELAPGDYRLRVLQRGLTAIARTVRILDGDDAHHQTLAIEIPAPGSIQGHVEVVHGENVRGSLQVQLTRLASDAGAETLWSTGAMLRESGEFAFHELPPGRYLLTCAALSKREQVHAIIAELELAAGEARAVDERVDLADVGELTVRVEDFLGHPVPRALVRFRLAPAQLMAGDARTDSDGTCRSPLPRGHYQLLVSGSGLARHTLDDVVVTGLQSTVTVTLPATARQLTKAEVAALFPPTERLVIMEVGIPVPAIAQLLEQVSPDIVSIPGQWTSTQRIAYPTHSYPYVVAHALARRDDVTATIEGSRLVLRPAGK